MTYERVMVRFAVVLGAVLATCVFLTARASALVVAACPSVTSPQTLPTAVLGVSYSYTFTGCGDSWSLTGTLPAGLTFDAAQQKISGTATGSVSTARLTVTATSSDTVATEDVVLPVADALQVDAGKGELTGVTTDTNGLVYVAGSTAGSVFDIDSSSHATGTAASELNFPAAVATTPPAFGPFGLLWATQFGSPPADGAPLTLDPTPTSTADPALPGLPFPDADATCAKPDATANTAVFLGLFIAYSCAGSNQVQLDVVAPSLPGVGANCPSSNGFLPICALSTPLSPNGVPSGMAFDSDFDLFVADARNATVSEFALPGGQAVVNLPAGSTPANVALDSGNGTLYVADPGTSQISMLKPSTDQSTGNPVLTDAGEINLPGCRPFGVAVNDAGDTVVATCSTTGTAPIIDVSGAKPAIVAAPQIGFLPDGTLPAGGPVPDGVTVVGDQAFIANEKGGTVTVISLAAPATMATSQLAVSHARRSLVHVAPRKTTALRKLRRYITLTRGHKHLSRHQRQVMLHRLTKQILLAAKRARKHHRHATTTTAAAATADPLVAPLSPFTR